MLFFDRKELFSTIFLLLASMVKWLFFVLFFYLNRFRSLLFSHILRFLFHPVIFFPSLFLIASLSYLFFILLRQLQCSCLLGWIYSLPIIRDKFQIWFVWPGVSWLVRTGSGSGFLIDDVENALLVPLGFEFLLCLEDALYLMRFSDLNILLLILRLIDDIVPVLMVHD